MAKRPSSQDYQFATLNGGPSSGQDAIFPILKNIDGEWKIIGTGFFVTNNGIFVTAWHVLKEALDASGGMNCNGIAAFHFVPDNQFVIRPVLRACHRPNSDVTLGVLAEARHNVTGDLLFNGMMTLTTKQIEVGCDIVTWAYPNATSRIAGKKQSLYFTPQFLDGVVQEYHPNMRDRHLLPFSCYRGDVSLPGGTSGGPMVEINSGRVFGVNCTSFEGQDDSISYYANVNAIIDLWVDDVTLDGRWRERVTVSELISRGLIRYD